MKSVINEAKFTRRYNLGEYEFEEYTLAAVVDEKESGIEVLRQMKAQVGEAFSGANSSEEKTTEEKPAKRGRGKANAKSVTGNGKGKTGKVSDEEDSVADEESDLDEEAAEVESETDADLDSDAEEIEGLDDEEEEAESEEADEEEAKPAPKQAPAKKEAGKAAGKKNFKVKPQVYDRNIEQHKVLFSAALRAIVPDWSKSDAMKAKAKTLSKGLEGKDFLDENGEVVDTFKALIKKHMVAKAK